MKSPRFIIEIVVHHDIDESTAERYMESGTPVAKIRPAWETVDRLRKQLVSDEILNVEDNVCPGRKENNRRHRERLEDIEGKLNCQWRRPTIEFHRKFDARRCPDGTCSRFSAGCGS